MSGRRCTISGVVLTLLATAGLILACAYLLRTSRSGRRGDDHLRRLNERRTYLNLLAIADAQESYRAVDWDGNGIKIYTPFLAHLWQTVDGKGRPVKTRFISRRLAFAMDRHVAADGYYYRLLHRKGPGDRPRMIDYQKEWAVAAMPAVPWRTGRVVFLSGAGNAVFVRPIAADSVRYPIHPEREGWTAVGSLDVLDAYLAGLAAAP
jgi:hypothetical protein